MEILELIVLEIEGVSVLAGDRLTEGLCVRVCDPVCDVDLVIDGVLVGVDENDCVGVTEGDSDLVGEAETDCEVVCDGDHDGVRVGVGDGD